MSKLVNEFRQIKDVKIMPEQHFHRYHAAFLKLTAPEIFFDDEWLFTKI